MTKTKSTKSALIASVFALFLCFTMLLGTTFAWFTDSATSGSNVIQSGTLDIVLEYWNGTEWADAEGVQLDFQKASTSAGTEVLWEPGCTYELPKIRVRNEGNLAAYVVLRLNGVTGDEKLMEAIELKTKVSNIPESILNGSQAASYEKFLDAPVDMIYGTPDGTVIFDWSLMGKGQVSPNSGHTDTSAEFTIVGHMDENVGNEYQGLKIEGVSITALATQQVYEYDSFGRDYDENATYPDEIISETGLYNSTLNSGSVKLGADLQTSKSTVHYNSNREYAIRDSVDYTIDLNGYTINHDGTYQNGNNTGYTYLYTTAYNGKLTINGDGVINSANSEGLACIAYAQGPSEIIINGGDFNVDKGIAVWAGNNSVVTINGGSFISTGSDNQELIYSSGGIIYINGGFFHNTLQDNRPVNVANANRGTGYIYISGGTFVNFDPSTGGDDPSNILVVDGYKVVSEPQANGDIWYTVVAE